MNYIPGMKHADRPDIIKFFYEEPAWLESQSADDDPDARERNAPDSLAQFLASRPYYRGYLAGSSLAAGTIGLTSIDRHKAMREILLSLGVARRISIRTASSPEPADDPSILIDRPGDVLMATFGGEPVGAAEAIALRTDERRRWLNVLRGILDSGAIVLFPEPAHHGHDWDIYSPIPLLSVMQPVLTGIAADDLRVFAIPHNRARSEEKFYFEQYDPDLFSEFELKPR